MIEGTGTLDSVRENQLTGAPIPYLNRYGIVSERIRQLRTLAASTISPSNLLRHVFGQCRVGASSGREARQLVRSLFEGGIRVALVMKNVQERLPIRFNLSSELLQSLSGSRGNRLLVGCGDPTH